MSRYRSLYSPMGAAEPWPDQSYKCGPGLCVIISNTKFDSLENLPAGVKDEESLQCLFTILNFEVKLHRNLKAKEIKSTVESYSKRKHKGAFFLAILSHGTTENNEALACGTDGKTVKIEDLQKFFTAAVCPSLRGKPKIFLIDTCRGDKGEMFLPCTSKATAQTRSGTNQCTPKIVADNADFAIVYATTKGNTAHIDCNEGSYLTQTFVEVILKADLKEGKSFNSILNEVKRRVQETGKQLVEIVDRLTYDYYITRNTKLSGLHGNITDIKTAVQYWILIRNETISKIEATADKLQEHHRNVNISRVVGSSVSIGGGVLAIVGFALTPVTFGASLGLSIGGVALAAAGGATAAGASIADVAIQKSNVNFAQEQLHKDHEKLESINKMVDELNARIENLSRECPSNAGAKILITELLAQGSIRAGNIGLRVTEAALSSSLEVGAAALRVGGVAAKGIAAAGLVLNVALIPIDLVEIVRSSHSLAKGSKTKAIEELRDIATKLESEKQEIKKQFSSHE